MSPIKKILVRKAWKSGGSLMKLRTHRHLPLFLVCGSGEGKSFCANFQLRPLFAFLLLRVLATDGSLERLKQWGVFIPPHFPKKKNRGAKSREEVFRPTRPRLWPLWPRRKNEEEGLLLVLANQKVANQWAPSLSLNPFSLDSIAHSGWGRNTKSADCIQGELQTFSTA